MKQFLYLFAILALFSVNIGCNQTETTDDADNEDADLADSDFNSTDSDNDIDPDADERDPERSRTGFILIHCDPQEMLQLHNNFNVKQYDYDDSKSIEPTDMWLALMDLVDQADHLGHKLTLQLSPPYVEHIPTTECDAMLGSGRTYPATTGELFNTCLDLIFGWQANGHELSVHHHGPNHDPVKFDGYTNLDTWTTRGQRSCSVETEPCDCEPGGCAWCAPPQSDLICQLQGEPGSAIGVDPEWRGPATGPGGMWELIETILGPHTVRSICMNHSDEHADMPSDPDLIYTTQGGDFVNDPEDSPRCVAYDVAREYHGQTKFTWFYSHGLFSSTEDMAEVTASLEAMGPDGNGSVLGIVFHVNDFVRTQLAPEGTPGSGLHMNLLELLADPDSDGDPTDEVRIDTLSELLREAGKLEAPDPCVESCFSLDESSDISVYTIPVPRPNFCE